MVFTGDTVGVDASDSARGVVDRERDCGGGITAG